MAVASSILSPLNRIKILLQVQTLETVKEGAFTAKKIFNSKYLI
jgi:hypothetical protein